MNFTQRITAQQISETFASQIQRISGDLNVVIDNFSLPAKSNETSFVYALDEKHLDLALNSQASCLLTTVKLSPLVENCETKKTVIFAPVPELLARHIKQTWGETKTPYRSPTQGVHPSAVIHPSVTLGASVTVGPNAVVDQNCSIGEGCYIGANSVIEADCQIGDHTTIHPLVSIGHSTVIGKKCEILPNTTIASEGFGYAQDSSFNHFRIPHTGKVVLEDDVHIGASCSIDRGTLEDTRIGYGTKIDNQCHVAHNLTIGRNCLITANFNCAGSTTIGNHFVAGGSANVNGHIEVCDNVKVAGMCGVNTSIKTPGVYGGFPIQPLDKFRRNQATFSKLADLRKIVMALKKKINL